MMLNFSRRFVAASRLVARRKGRHGRQMPAGTYLALLQNDCQFRFFSRKEPPETSFWVDPMEDDDEVVVGDDEDDVTFGRDFTANDMEYFDEIQDDSVAQRQKKVRDDEEERLKLEEAQQQRDELDAKTGRLWSDPWEITDEDWANKRTYEDLPDWRPDMCSRISKERVKVHPDGILTLETLANLPLPPPPPPHPGHGEAPAYASHRKSYIFKQIYEKVQELAKPRIDSILKLSDWNEKQDKIDELFESIEFELKESETILGKHPMFGDWVESALERYLQSVEQKERNKTTQRLLDSAKSMAAAKLSEIVEKPDATWKEKREALEELAGTLEVELRKEDRDLARHPQFDILVKRALKRYAREAGVEGDGGDGEDGSALRQSAPDDMATPVFMDLYDPNDGPSVVVPKILHPLAPHSRDGPGRMVEEWELAAHKQTKRVMLRQCTRQMARILSDNDSSRIVVTGQQGVGKTAALTAIVASARKSGNIVLYLPDGDRMKRNFYYIEPNARREGIFDLPVLSQEVCDQLLESHGSDLEGMTADSETINQFFTEPQIKRLPTESTHKVSLLELLREGKENHSMAAMCYAAVVHTLMNQTEKPFVMVLDDFNSYFDHGEYFHMEYDEQVKKSIPPDQVSLFQPALNALGLTVSNEERVKPSLSIKRGAIVVGMTESKAVSVRVTEALTESAQRTATDPDASAPMHVLEVPRYSIMETDHIISNMEVIGIGRLRFDRGDTVMNDQEVAYLRMLSGGSGQHLLDACII